MIKFNENKLDEVAGNSLYTTFTNAKTINYSFSIFQRFISKGMSILELGPAEGLMTEKLLGIDPCLTVVEGSKVYAEQLKTKYAQINVVNALFENATLDRKFDVIVLGHVLEHVENPSIILEAIKKWLNPDGIVLAAVPNARSLHRQAAVEMRLIKSIFEQSEKDVHHGHLRIYTPETFYSEFLQADFQILAKGGYWLKPISDGQIEKSWDAKMLHAFMVLGEQYPDIAAEIYVVAKLN